jgi:hypothetical protein
MRRTTWPRRWEDEGSCDKVETRGKYDSKGFAEVEVKSPYGGGEKEKSAKDGVTSGGKLKCDFSGKEVEFTMSGGGGVYGKVANNLFFGWDPGKGIVFKYTNKDVRYGGGSSYINFNKNDQGGEHMSQVKFNAALYLHTPLL